MFPHSKIEGNRKPEIIFESCQSKETIEYEPVNYTQFKLRLARFLEKISLLYHLNE